jgi:Holliday junction resolvase
MGKDNLKNESNNANTLLGAVFLPTSNRVPQIEYKLIAIDIYGRYVIECSSNRNNIIYITKEQFDRDFKNCT